MIQQLNHFLFNRIYHGSCVLGIIFKKNKIFQNHPIKFRSDKFRLDKTNFICFSFKISKLSYITYCIRFDYFYL